MSAAGELGSVQSGDTRIYYQIYGSGPPLVLLHPYPTNHDFWSRISAGLSSRYRLLIPDLRAHGHSEPGDGPATMEKHARDLTTLCQATGVDRAIFFGVSIGGYILFEFWRRERARIKALVLCDTKAAPDATEARASRLNIAEQVEKEGPNAYLDSMLPKLLGATSMRNRPDLVKEARRMMAAVSVAGIAAALRGMAERPDSMPTLRAINVPTLVMVGEEDTLTPFSDAQAMHDGVHGSKLAKIPAAGHYAPFEQPEATLRVLRNFLDSLPAD